MNWQLSNKEKCGRWTLAGALEINSVGTLREQLIELSKTEDFGRLDLAEVSACDLTSLQMLIAFQKTMQTSDRSHSLENPSGAIQAACNSLGVPETIFTRTEQVTLI